MERIKYLDSHRGIAILLVVFYHLFSRWSEILPYGNSFTNMVFNQGFLGVQLFFLLSGFVILMTLERTKSFSSFIYKRWLRLFPAMLICTLIIVLSANLFSSRPIGEIEFKNIIPGLTFIDPYWFEKISGVPFSSLEGAFWSLYVEFKFYVIAAFLYYILNEKKLTFSLFGLFLIAVSANQLNQTYSNSIIYSIHSISTHLSLGFFGWFASGASLYLFYKSKQMKWFICGFSMAMISSFLLYRDNYHTMVFAFTISFFFTSTFISPIIQKTLQNRVLMFVGFISYPLYLIHENMMISIVIDLSNFLPSMPLIVPPIMAILLVLLISFIVSKYLENNIKNICKMLIEKTPLRIIT